MFGQLERLDHVVHDFMACMQEGHEPALEELDSEDVERLQRMLAGPSSGPGPVLGPPVLVGASPAIGIETLLGFLGSLAKTGVLRVRAGDTRFMISVVRGDVVHGVCDPRPENELIGSLLLARGAIGSDAMSRFFDTCGASASRIVEALNGEELVPSELLREVLAQQMQMLFHRLLAAEGAEGCFHEGEATLSYVNLRVNVNRMLLETTRGKDESVAPAGALPASKDEAEVGIEGEAEVGTEKKPLALVRPDPKFQPMVRGFRHKR
ncbi:MAG TPA: DUF4388 domain-containing protein [Planctomycetota bacterium]|nr:DUF4388 domain-containing protein [Planctomycetota bacterium]